MTNASHLVTNVRPDFADVTFVRPDVTNVRPHAANPAGHRHWGNSNPIQDRLAGAGELQASSGVSWGTSDPVWAARWGT
ncbi:MAG TPA: hypothetical protein VFC82_00650 [Actinomycetaceae bacterium]|nr:hypothetical protein [Actinomycetaceae bacterium]